MTSLFKRVQPQKFLITPELIAQYLGIPVTDIFRVEKWKYIVFVHRRGRGGQFISYRQLKPWLEKIIDLIKSCLQTEQLSKIASGLKQEWRKFKKHYPEEIKGRLRGILAQKRDSLLKQQQKYLENIENLLSSIGWES